MLTRLVQLLLWLVSTLLLVGGAQATARLPANSHNVRIFGYENTGAAELPLRRLRTEYQTSGFALGICPKTGIRVLWDRVRSRGLQFTGKERDAETGLDYFGARYMSSAQGRFTSPDPVNHPSASKNPSAFLMNPQRWNGYSYVSNNPLRLVDPDGREEEESWLEMGKRYLAALFQPVSSVDAMTNPRVSGEQTAPWPTDPHEFAVGATREAGQRAELAFNALSVFDVTGAGQLGKSMIEGSPGGVALAAMGVIMPGGRSGGNIALSEAKQLVGGWSANTSFGAKVGKSIAYHFGEHGAGVGAKDVWQYLRKAEGFAKNLKGVNRPGFPGGSNT
ncbi:MAG: RHS repeat-associated core domain-containing protein [Bryobacter sp.]|nr:RHS repeat-associated core domain-containing protein [Bryobacter sp.]